MVDWFTNTRVRNKILLGYGIVVLFTALIGVVVFVQGAALESERTQLDRVENVQTATALMNAAVADRLTALRDFMLTGDAAALEQYTAAGERLEQHAQEARSLIRDSSQVARLDTAVTVAQVWTQQVAEPAIEAKRQALTGPLPPAVLQALSGGEGTRSRDVLRRLDARAQAIASERHARMQEAVARMQILTVLLTVLAVTVGVIVAVWIAGRIARPLNRAVLFAEAVAGGDLTGRLESTGDDELGRLEDSLNTMSSKLRRLVGEVNETTTQVASAAEQIAATSERISSTVDDQVGSTEAMSSSMEEIAAQIARVAQNTEALAASVDQTSSSIAQMGQAIESTAVNSEALGSAVDETSTTMEEMAASITQAEHHTVETRRIAESAAEDAQDGGAAMSQVTAGMDAIHQDLNRLVTTIHALDRAGESVDRISELMEEIADQTNLLALNASIEAARAGEHGRGFAVVAQEVRRLAERSVESARDIRGTIDEVRARVRDATESSDVMAERTREGREVVERAAGVLTKILESSTRTRDLMDEVAVATEEQTRAASQTHEAMRHIQRIAEESRIATREQAMSSRQIVEAVERMNRQTQEVFEATAEQKRGGELILQSTEQISGGARDAQSAVQELVRAARDLSAQATRLTALVSTFHV